MTTPKDGKPRCCETVRAGSTWHPYSKPCNKSASTEHDGKPYCKLHNPAIKKAKQDASYAAYKAKNNAMFEARAKQAKRNELFGPLVEACGCLAGLSCDDHCSELADEQTKCIHAKARALLAEAKTCL